MFELNLVLILWSDLSLLFPLSNCYYLPCCFSVAAVIVVVYFAVTAFVAFVVSVVVVVFILLLWLLCRGCYVVIVFVVVCVFFMLLLSLPLYLLPFFLLFLHSAYSLLSTD